MIERSPDLEKQGAWVRLRRGKVVQWGLAYLAGAWGLLQGLGFAADAFAWPAAIKQVALILLLLGLPVTVVLAWYHGEKGEQRVTRMELAVLTVLLLLAGGALWVYGHQLHTAPVVGATAPSVAMSPSAPPPPARSIAVLPFTDMSEKRDQEYFSDGLSEELIDLLCQIPQLRVIARTSSFAFKGKDAGIAEIAQKLNVANVLEGSVRKSGDKLRITAQLIRTSDSTHLWSQTYDRPMTDVFQIQDEIAAAIVAALKMTLATPVTTAPRRTANSEAYVQYLIGKQLLENQRSDDFPRALEAFQKAVALDPTYGVAYAGLARATMWVGDWLEGAPAAIGPALAAAEKAIALAPDAADGYAARGFIRSTWVWDWSGARADFEKALTLEPGNAYAQARYGVLLASVGQMSEAIGRYRRSVENDPMSPMNWCDLGSILASAGRQTEAREAVRRGLDIAPRHDLCWFWLGYIDLGQGRPDQALADFQRTDGVPFFYLAGTAMAEHSLGHAKQSQEALDKLIHLGNPVMYQVADVYAWRGEKDQAFAWLDRAYEKRDGGLPSLRYDIYVDSLRGDSRYAALLRKMRLDDDSLRTWNAGSTSPGTATGTH